MMYGLKRLSEIFTSAQTIPFDDASRIVIMSDCHRGDGSWADTFSKNQNICFAALTHYYQQHYTYIELGDGDELWENRAFADITHAHKDVFWLLTRFYQMGRLFFVYGNHDMVKKSPKYIEQNLFRYYDARLKKHVGLFENIHLHEGLVLRHAETGDAIFLVHGHQVDFLNSRLWRLARFLVHYLWRPLEVFGVNDPTSTAKNYRKKASVEKRLIKWVESENGMLIAGHTHRSVLPDVGEPRYFNDGSCVHPRCITAIEIADGNIMLVKWSVKTRHDGTLFIGREVLAGPTRLHDYFE